MKACSYEPMFHAYDDWLMTALQISEETWIVDEWAQDKSFSPDCLIDIRHHKMS